VATRLKRISDEPAFVLHRYDWSESSLILEVFTRHHGRLAIAAKGVKRPTSSFRPVLLPLQPLTIAFSGENDIRTLKAAEWVGGHVMPSGHALMCGLYLNELLMRLLGRDDPHPGLYDQYRAVVRWLAAAPVEAQEPALRAFELLLLRQVGLLPQLDRVTLTGEPLAHGASYVLIPEVGIRPAHDDDRASLLGHQWLGVQLALNHMAPVGAVLSLFAGEQVDASLGPLKPLLRQWVAYHCGGQALRTRQLMIDLQSYA
jgi:DNA repair protein RecO (recombination protein O)